MTAPGWKWRWAHVDASGDPARYVGILNQVRQTDAPDQYPATLAFIAAQPGERILEMGCGNGAVARAVARQGAARQIVAVDYSAALIAEAQRQATPDLPVPVRFAVADAGRLPFPEHAFDRCYAMEVFVILPDPRRALDELVRVLRPGGTLCIWESDCDARSVDATDLELTRRIQRFIGDHEYNGAVARQLIGWCREQGLAVQYQAGLGVQETSTFMRSFFLDEWLDDAVRAGVVTAAEVQRWLDDLAAREAAGRFFAYLPHFRITATRPPALDA